jgi:hypothetical protein
MIIAEQDNWMTGGRNILRAETLSLIRQTLEESPVVLEHWFYRGARAPARLVFEDFDDLLAYLKQNARPGDAFHVWKYAEVCRDENELASGKYPDEAGRVPKGGAY